MPYRLFVKWVRRMFSGKKNVRIGIYGPPNTGKTSLANRVITDFVGGAGWNVSETPHETRSIQVMSEVILKSKSGKTLTIDLYDMPGLSTKQELHTDAFDEFLKTGMSESEAVLRLMEATEGIAASVRAMKKIDSAIVVLDSTESPYTKVNALLLGVLKANDVKIIVAANKIDLPHANPDLIRRALPDLPVVPISCIKNKHIEDLYEAVAKHH